MTQSNPVLIVLNGASSAGKTLTGQALVKQLGGQTVQTGFDDILERAQPFGPEGGLGNALQRAVKIAWFNFSDGRLRLFKQLHRDVVSLHQSGRNVIVETAFMDPRALQDAALCFAPINGLFVGMKPPLAVSEQWEATRQDRPTGQARRHYAFIHSHNTYDLVLDSSQMTPDACASAIMHRLAEAPPTAFQTLTKAATKPQ